MQQPITFSWCCLLYAVFLAVEGMYIPTDSSRLTQISQYKEWKRANMDWWEGEKRSRSEYQMFMDGLARQAQRRHHRDRHEFVEEMFRIFDMNRDGVIEIYEFRSILQVMGIVPSSRRMY